MGLREERERQVSTGSDNRTKLIFLFQRHTIRAAGQAVQGAFSLPAGREPGALKPPPQGEEVCCPVKEVSGCFWAGLSARRTPGPID